MLVQSTFHRDFLKIDAWIGDLFSSGKSKEKTIFCLSIILSIKAETDQRFVVHFRGVSRKIWRYATSHILKSWHVGRFRSPLHCNWLRIPSPNPRVHSVCAWRYKCIHTSPHRQLWVLLRRQAAHSSSRTTAVSSTFISSELRDRKSVVRERV